MTDLYEKVVRKMNTFVCEVCHNEELAAHTLRPRDPLYDFDGSDRWYRGMAQRAKEEGWVLRPPPATRKNWFFAEFQVVGPKCAAKLAAGQTEK